MNTSSPIGAINMVWEKLWKLNIHARLKDVYVESSWRGVAIEGCY